MKEFFEIKGNLIRKDLVNCLHIDDEGIITVQFFSGKDLVIEFRELDYEKTKALIEKVGEGKFWNNQHSYITKPTKGFKPAVDKLKKEVGLILIKKEV